MNFLNNFKYSLKDRIKNILHNSVIIPYRKKSKRYRIWNYKTEEKFISKIEEIYIKNKDQFENILVSIVMPVFNRADIVGKAIESVLNQSHQAWQLIIIDDGGTDNLDKVVRNFKNDKKINFIRIEHNGVSYARNKGLELAEGKYVFYLDSDNQWTENYLRYMISLMEFGQLNSSYAGLRIFDDENKVVGYFGETFSWRSCHELNFIDLNSFAHRKDLVDESTRFDTKLRRLVDWDFILSVTSKNRVVFAPFIGVYYYDGRNQNRITTTECQGEQIFMIIDYIKNKHLSVANQICDIADLQWAKIVTKGWKKD